MIAKQMGQMAKYAVLAAGMIVILIPVYVTLSTALKTPHQSAISFFSPPSGLYLGNFYEIVNSTKFWTYLMNSVMITVISVALMLVVVPMVSYAISRNAKSKYYVFLYFIILSGIFVPFQVIMLPMAKQMAALDLLNRSGLIIMHVTYALTQGTFLCVGYLKSIPLELDEAAKIDGCGVWKIFTRIIYRLMTPILATFLILKSLFVWNDFIFSLIILNRSNEFWTLPLYIYNFKTEYSFNYNLAFAGFFMSMVPILIVYALTQRFIITGLTEGALKH
ncbi:carbohydrate ABC transporter permease [Paenibacillus alkalitolerans]|uniref:carbohydrate ABC transporter permease n=1 Tax=Paenibacillus alkalitolerans TaxID=2799335 RepID=UPI002D80D381|nr:carbohydrate ABC transporter permease [Paenibacillus alkalitolerans]